MLCSLQKRLTVSASHRDAPSSSGPSATERNKGTHSFCCAEREAGWEPAVPALLRQDEVPRPWDHPATPARAGDTAPTAARPTPAAWGNSRSAVGQQERQRQVPSGLLRSCWALGSPRCCSAPLLPAAERPRSASRTAATGTSSAEAELPRWDYPSVPGRAEQASMSVLGSGLRSHRKQSWLIFSSFVQPLTKNSPKFMGLINL